MSITQRRVAVIGAGLVGGSIARALHGRPEVEVVVSDRDPETRARARAAGLEVADDAAGAVRGAHLVVLAVPSSQLGQLVMDLRRSLSRGAIVLETGCIKREALPCADVLRRVRPDVRFVLSNPLVGGAFGGFAHADAGLFAHTPWIVGQPDDDAAVVHDVEQFVVSLGAEPVLNVTAADQDVATGVVGLTPHLVVPVATAHLAGADGAVPVHPALFARALRLATSPELLWAENLATGWPRVAPMLERAASHLETLLFGLGHRAELEGYAASTAALRAPVVRRYPDEVILPTGDAVADEQLRVVEMLGYAIVQAAADIAGWDHYGAPTPFELAGPAFADVTACAGQGLEQLVAASAESDHEVLMSYRAAIHRAERIITDSQRVLLELQSVRSGDLVVFGLADVAPVPPIPSSPRLRECCALAQRAYAGARRQAPEFAP